MSVFYDLNKTPRNILNQAIVRAIVSENNGALFDPSDLSTLYQDAAGTTPVTAVEQPVGKMLDKSGNGYHATQSITASRPTLSARYNLLTKTEDFSDAVWLKTAGAIVNSAVSNPINAAQVSKFIPDTTNAIHRIAQPWNPSLGVNYTQTILLKSAGVRYATINVLTNIQNRTTIDLQNGATISTGAAVVNVTVNSLPDGWFSLSITGIGTSAVGNNTWIQAGNAFIASDSTYAGDGVSGFYLIAADLRIGTTAGSYQRVNTSTDYDTDERYFKKYLRFDGVDDYLNLPYMGLYAAGSASAILCVDDRTQSVNARVLSESSSTTSSQYTIRNLTSGGIDSYIADDAGAAFVDSPNTKGIESKNYIISVIDSGSNVTRYRNSVYENVQSYSRAGKSFTANKTTIGALDTMGAVVAYTAMNLYGLIVTKSALTDAQRIACERHLSRKAGVAL